MTRELDPLMMLVARQNDALNVLTAERDALRTELETRKNEIETLKDMLTDAVEEKEMAEAELRDLRLRWSPEYGH